MRRRQSLGPRRRRHLCHLRRGRRRRPQQQGVRRRDEEQVEEGAGEAQGHGTHQPHVRGDQVRRRVGDVGAGRSQRGRKKVDEEGEVQQLCFIRDTFHKAQLFGPKT